MSEMSEVSTRKVRRPRAPGTPSPSERGTLALSIPQAGRMAGLSRAKAYQAARQGLIPTLDFGGRKIVPKATWLRMLGIELTATQVEM